MRPPLFPDLPVCRLPLPGRINYPIALLVLLFSFPDANAQSYHSDEYLHAGIGISTGSLSFQENGTGGLSILLRGDLLKSTNSTLSLGTNLKLGTADKSGLVFPLSVLEVLSGSPSGADLTNDWVGFFADIPLLLNYNFGLGSDYFSNHRFGFYLGGGVSYTLSSITNNAGLRQNASFSGWVANIGIRFAKYRDIGFSMTIPQNNPIGPINNPILYQLTFSVFTRY